LLIAPLRDGELEPRLAPLVPEELDLGRAGFSILELDSVAPLVHVLVLHDSQQLDDVRLGDGLTRVHETLGEIAVVGHDEHSARVEVEPSHRIDPSRHVGQQLANAGAAFGVTHCGDDATWLVQSRVDSRFSDDSASVDLDVTRARVDFGPKRRDHLPVDAHSPGLYELLRGATRSHAGARKNLLQTERGHDPA
jgi:hypothetical protein